MSVTTSRKAYEVIHVMIEASRPFEQVRLALEAIVPPIDPEIPVLLQDGLTDRLRQRLEAAPELSIFLTRDHGMLLGIYGKVEKAVQYEIGNPLTAERMTRHVLAAGLYAPLRVILLEEEERVFFEYDLPSSLFAQFGDERVAAVGRELDDELEAALALAGGLR